MALKLARVEGVFNEAVGRSTPADRAAYLDQACGDDAELRQRVEALLTAHDGAGSFLGLPASDPARTTDTGGSLREGPGTVIGRYKLLEQIGEGGFGVVFMAEQREPVRRKVALKIIKLGMDTRQVVARFEAERQALAMMDHPNIAKVLDAGSTDTGRPYFVMELVRGTPITEYCDKHQLTTKERLELVVQVCQAVQHAHSKGIIHRDLKPTNVLVTIADGRPVPKVIDFGVAKATQNRLTEKTLFTEFRQLIGTPQYMSPEQAESDGIDIDTRSDVYSLGVLLYELLTGTTPLDAKELRSKAYAEMERMIREVEPPTPSTRLSTLGDAATAIAASRKTEPDKLGQLLRGEVDWIVMRALEKNRSRRYETANALARDIERHLADDPVEACPPSVTYKLRKFVRKYRAPLRVAATIVLLLIAATIVSSWQAVRATRATAREAAQRKQADVVAALLESVFQRLDPFAEQKGGPDIKAQLVGELDQVATDLERNYRGEPLVRARLRSVLGQTQLGLGEIAKAQALLESAVMEQRLYVGADDRQTLATSSHLARVYHLAGRTAQAMTLFEQVRNEQIKSLGADDPDTLATMCNLGRAYQDAGRTADAVHVLESAREQQIKKLGIGHHDTLDTQSTLAEAYWSAGRLGEATKLVQQVLDQRIRTIGREHPDTLDALSALATDYRHAGQTDKAIELFEQVRDQQTKRLPADHYKVLETLNDLALAYESAGRIADSIKLFEHVWDQQSKKLGPDHPETLIVLSNLAYACWSARRTSEAIRLLEQLIQLKTRKLGSEDTATLRSVHDLAIVYQEASKYPQAQPLWEKLVAWYSTHPEGLPYRSLTIDILPRLIACDRGLGQLDRARETEQQLFALEQKFRAGLEANLTARSAEIANLGEGNPNLVTSVMARACLYLRLGRFEEADADLARVLQTGTDEIWASYYHGCLLACMGRAAPYRENCLAMFKQFGNSSDGPILDKTAKTCLLMPDGAGGDPNEMLPLIDRAMGQPHDVSLWRYYSLNKALCLYRMGDYAGCIGWAEQVPDDWWAVARSATAPVLAAMGHYRLGHLDQARAALERAERRAVRDPPKAGEADLGWGNVENWLVYQTLHREAEALIIGKAPSTQPIASMRLRSSD